MFTRLESHFKIYKRKYEKGFMILNGCIATHVINGHIAPSFISSYDLHYNIALAKFESEYSERTLLALGVSSDKLILVRNIFNGYCRYLRESDVSYGMSSEYGYIDTTGTASGVSSTLSIVRKGVLELIEKNELLLFWYGGYGKEIYELNAEALDFAKVYCERVDEALVFGIQQLSNAITCIVFLLTNGKVCGFGISADFSLKKAFTNAIWEATMQAVVYADEKIGYFKYIKEDEFYCVYDLLQRRRLSPKQKEWVNLNKSAICVDAEFRDLEIAVLNKYSNNYGKTIKVYSKTIYNCMPRRVNLLKSKQKKILEVFGVDAMNNCIPDCFVV